MKNVLTLIIALLAGSFQQIVSATMVTFQPGVSGKDAFIQHLLSDPSGDNTNFGDFRSMEAMAWTWSGQNGTLRSLLEFDLTSIPSNAVVSSAILSLHNDPASAENGGQHSILSGSNECYLKRITAPWNESTVTWNNQPATTSTGQITIPASFTPNQDYPNIDVTAMATDMIHNPSTNYGFMFQLVTEVKFRAMIFASSDHSETSRHPALTVTYSIPVPVPVPTLSTPAFILLSISMIGIAIFFLKKLV